MRTIKPVTSSVKNQFSQMKQKVNQAYVMSCTLVILLSSDMQGCFVQFREKIHNYKRCGQILAYLSTLNLHLFLVRNIWWDVKFLIIFTSRLTYYSCSNNSGETRSSVWRLLTLQSEDLLHIWQRRRHRHMYFYVYFRV